MKDFEQWVNEKHPEYEQEPEAPEQEETKEDVPTEGYNPVVSGIAHWKRTQEDQEKSLAQELLLDAQEGMGKIYQYLMFKDHQSGGISFKEIWKDFNKKLTNYGCRELVV